MRIARIALPATNRYNHLAMRSTEESLFGFDALTSLFL